MKEGLRANNDAWFLQQVIGKAANAGVLDKLRISMSLTSSGVPMTQMIQSGTFYHASGDVYEAVPQEGIERAARFHAFLIEKADQADEALINPGKGTPYESKLQACQ